MWDFLPTEATRFMAAAVTAAGSGSPAGEAAPSETAASKRATDEGAASDPGRESVGWRLVALVFGLQDGQGPPGAHGLVGSHRLPGALARLARDPGSRRARDDLEHQVFEALEADPALLPRAVAVIEAFYRRRANAGDARALAELGDFLYWDEPAAARAAYQAAIRAGHSRATISLARLLLNVLEDEQAALVVYEQAAASEDQDLGAEAMYQVALVHMARRDVTAARAVLERVIETRHPVWAAAAMVGLARQQDVDSARSLYRRAIKEGDADWSARASWLLANLLQREGDIAAAAAVWQRVIDSGQPGWAAAALTSLVNLLAGQRDDQGLRAAYDDGLARGIPAAPYALLQLGQVLAERRDVTGAQQAWQEAIDAGCEDARSWRERMLAASASDPGEPVAGPG